MVLQLRIFMTCLCQAKRRLLGKTKFSSIQIWYNVNQLAEVDSEDLYAEVIMLGALFFFCLLNASGDF